MGGEPTFVSVDDYQSPEWTVAALGAEKRVRADALTRRLRERFAPQGLLHYGLGKWYPGEAMPRWAFSLYWRRDGKPLWRDASLIAHEAETRLPGADDAKRFAETIAARLGVAADRVHAAYEDQTHWMLEESKLPVNVDPRDPKLFDAAARARMVRAFERGLGSPAAYVLPLRRTDARWASERWETRREQIFLLPGDLPAGSRLPLSPLPHVDPQDYPIVAQIDPTADTGPLPDPDAAAQPAEEVVTRTALVVEPRDGRLCVFMPYLGALEDYVDALAAVEEAAQTLGAPVHIEGYAPPTDPRLDVIKVTPDPGVVEVNLHRREKLARRRGDHHTASTRMRGVTRLGAEKFMRDGRQTGTGGGSHIVVGGRDTGDKPVPAPARPAQEHSALLAAPPLALLSVLRPVHRADQPIAARRRGAP